MGLVSVPLLAWLNGLGPVGWRGRCVYERSLVPHFESKRSIIDDQIRERTRFARTWVTPATDSRWYASYVKIRGDDSIQIDEVVVATQHSLLQAKRLSYENGSWFFEGPMTHWRITAQAEQMKSMRPCTLKPAVNWPLI